ncbi:hypothetical protein MUY21_04180 [Aliiroseovarius sp. S2029]|uniref:hypothetical protein n=1 Tax=Aliiroseovarius sp. S2029 TaxID=2936988 RepID=UPI0020C185BA|nr:hypothetical protein [Aliiroseovarius sp. S2029]MCK8483227.1 hypothetical protein [Aliiroseovarius sp. S2029]
MSFVRPEAGEALARYREAMVGVAVILLGLWWAIGSLGLIKWIGLTVVAFGIAILWSGLRHARIRAGHGGVGVVQVDERQITYLAPVGGGFASLDDVGRIEIATDRAGLAVWRFRTGNEILFIPVRAEGAEALFDALTALSGANIDAAIRAANQPPNDTVVIWQRGVAKLH